MNGLLLVSVVIKPDTLAEQVRQELVRLSRVPHAREVLCMGDSLYAVDEVRLDAQPPGVTMQPFSMVAATLYVTKRRQQ